MCCTNSGIAAMWSLDRSTNGSSNWGNCSPPPSSAIALELAIRCVRFCSSQCCWRTNCPPMTPSCSFANELAKWNRAAVELRKAFAEIGVQLAMDIWLVMHTCTRTAQTIECTMIDKMKTEIERQSVCYGHFNCHHAKIHTSNAEKARSSRVMCTYVAIVMMRGIQCARYVGTCAKFWISTNQKRSEWVDCLHFLLIFSRYIWGTSNGFKIHQFAIYTSPIHRYSQLAAQTNTCGLSTIIENLTDVQRSHMNWNESRLSTYGGINAGRYPSVPCAAGWDAMSFACTSQYSLLFKLK